jgi:hypothetical protein
MSDSVNRRHWPIPQPREGADDLIASWDGIAATATKHRDKFFKFAPDDAVPVLEAKCEIDRRRTVAMIFKLPDGFDEGIAADYLDSYNYVIVFTALVFGKTRFMRMYQFGWSAMVCDLKAAVGNPNRISAYRQGYVAVQCDKCKKHGLLQLPPVSDDQRSNALTVVYVDSRKLLDYGKAKRKPKRL